MAKKKSYKQQKKQINKMTKARIKKIKKGQTASDYNRKRGSAW